MRSLTRDNKCSGEREQALKLIRAFVEIGSERRTPQAPAGLGKVPLSETVMRALIAIAEHPEDTLNLITCQTLHEIRTYYIYRTPIAFLISTTFWQF